MKQCGSLSLLVEKAVQRALASGALITLETESETVEDEGVPFLIRILSSQLRKEQAAVFESKAPGKRRNPFLPYDPNLFVTELSDTHLCLLNKYNVVDRHLLMVTRKFQSQEEPLSPGDFHTIAVCLSELEGLAFYNSDSTAGASQPHRHLQFVPLESEREFRFLPIEAAVPGTQRNFPVVSRRLPFRQGWILFENLPLGELELMTEQLQRDYRRLADLVGKGSSYNLLVTRRWMMLVPRSRESFRSISVNALGYAGSLLVKNREEMEWIKQAGPMEVLRLCGRPSGLD